MVGSVVHARSGYVWTILQTSSLNLHSIPPQGSCCLTDFLLLTLSVCTRGDVGVELRQGPSFLLLLVVSLGKQECGHGRLSAL